MTFRPKSSHKQTNKILRMAQEIYHNQEVKRTILQREGIATPFWWKALGCLALLGWWAFATYWYVCKIKHHCDEVQAVIAPPTPPPIETVAPPPAPKSFVVSDGSQTIVDVKDVFKSRQTTDAVIVSNPLQVGVESLATYLKNNKDRELNIIGWYSKDEKNNTKFPDLGIARAEDVKKRLVALGIAAQRISTSSQVRDPYIIQNDTMMDCIAMNIAVTKAIEKDITIQPRTIYFQTGKSTIAMTPELEKYLANVKAYLQQKSTAKILLTGHTDNVGAENLNEQLGLERAQKTQNELTKVGIAADRTTLASKGERQPIKSNDTPAGRQANRRCEIVVVQ